MKKSNSPNQDPTITIPVAAMQAAEEGRLIDAIKLTREQLGVDLKTAQQAVEAYSSDVGGLKPLRFSEGIQPTQGALALSMC
ncbi:hypothetical protein BRW62_08310 [Parathermosynechococcus lividus PCC 6715]|uniref:Uncharacterized protein n=1 Tax=Parathermosynechococcus lividus PCC 6715 TaxID=1917166 RepID=A0A2D2Q2K0_PARLV|nr:hypothetical protein [Thermostichus lividus]ATS18751.1 hypothetical protein BRW62_08310 [Thermostichus lividus PCC 6715]